MSDGTCASDPAAGDAIEKLPRTENGLSGTSVAAPWFPRDHSEMKIYTRTGDDGTTGLIGGSRVRKSDPRMECTGTLDELNAAIGVAAVAADGAILAALREAQSNLFVIGSHLATPVDSTHRNALPLLNDSTVSDLERRIDAAEAQLSPLRNFILPGGSELGARLHLARTICRRAERVLVEFGADVGAAPITVRYLNRLSDWLFVEARVANRRAKIEDVPWYPDRGGSQI